MAIEIEAKFGVPDAATAARLAAQDSLGAYSLSPGKTVEVTDTYFDTHDQRLYAAGLACRSRQQGGVFSYTIKQIQAVQGAVHERGEWDVTLKEDAPPAQWPDSPARTRLLSITDSAPLEKLFVLHQTRIKRMVQKAGAEIAEWSLDHVRITAGGRSLEFRELEVELTADNREDLDVIARHLMETLVPEQESKFGKARTWLSA